MHTMRLVRHEVPRGRHHHGTCNIPYKLEVRVTTTSQAERSRLDPDPIPRRDVLGLGSLWAAASALIFATVGMLRLPKAAVLSSPSKKFRVTLPEALPIGQAYVLARLWVKLLFYGSEVAFFQASLAHAGYTASPSRAWPDSPAADAIIPS